MGSGRGRADRGPWWMNYGTTGAKRYRSRSHRSIAYAGDVDAAFEWLDRVTPLQGLATLGLYIPAFDNLNDDPRWAAYLERMGLSEERRAAISFEVGLPR